MRFALGFAAFFLFGNQASAVDLYTPPLLAESYAVLFCDQGDRYVFYEPDGSWQTISASYDLRFNAKRWSKIGDPRFVFQRSHPDEDCGELWDYLPYIDPETYEYYEYHLEFGPQ